MEFVNVDTMFKGLSAQYRLRRIFGFCRIYPKFLIPFNLLLSLLFGRTDLNTADRRDAEGKHTYLVPSLSSSEPVRLLLCGFKIAVIFFICFEIGLSHMKCV